ncbi:MAG TPA: hypothetical protein VEU77_03300 [Candidatus Acidoferrales bacterium]|nr:hypothetical protein [Candidatus Acidoferrales bacterium]
MTLELHVVASGDLDAAIADLREVRLERRAARTFITCDRAPLASVIAALARAGIEGSPVTPPTARAMRAAVLGHLDPIVLAETRDVVRIRCVPLGEAIDLVRDATRDLFGRRSRDRRDRIAALLHERDRLLLWRRILYAPSALLRARRIPGARPLVFDPEGADRARERVSLVSARRISTWIGT